MIPVNLVFRNLSSLSVLSWLCACGMGESPNGATKVIAGYTVEGRLTGTAGEPKADKAITLLRKGNEAGDRATSSPRYIRMGSIQTDVQGEFSFTGLASGFYALLEKGESGGAFETFEVTDGDRTVVLIDAPNGSLTGRIPADFMGGGASHYCRLDEVDESARIGSDGAFSFRPVPMGRYHLSFDLYQGGVDYALHPIEVEIDEDSQGTVLDSLFRPWRATVRIGSGTPPAWIDSMDVALLCVDSVMGCAKCLQFASLEARSGMGLAAYPIGSEIPLELTLFDRTGALIGRGRREWREVAGPELAIEVDRK